MYFSERRNTTYGDTESFLGIRRHMNIFLWHAFKQFMAFRYYKSL